MVMRCCAVDFWKDWSRFEQVHYYCRDSSILHTASWAAHLESGQAHQIARRPLFCVTSQEATAAVDGSSQPNVAQHESGRGILRQRSCSSIRVITAVNCQQTPEDLAVDQDLEYSAQTLRNLMIVDAQCTAPKHDIGCSNRRSSCRNRVRSTTDAVVCTRGWLLSG